MKDGEMGARVYDQAFERSEAYKWCAMLCLRVHGMKAGSHQRGSLGYGE